MGNLLLVRYLPDYINEFRKAIAIAQNEGLDKGKDAWLNVHPLKTAAHSPISSGLLRTMINDYSGWHWMNNNPHKTDPEGTIELMSQVKTPTLIVAGELSHPVLKDLISAQSQYIPNSKLVIIENSNHMLNIEKPDKFNKELESFLIENDIK